MQTGRVVRFDNVRGYGFIAPDLGGDDLFLHVNELHVPERFVHPGVSLEFEVEEGDRGLKATSVRLASSAGRPAVTDRAQYAPQQPSTPTPARVAAPTVAEPGEIDDVVCDVLSADEFRSEITELLLASVPTLTARDLLQVREAVLQRARSHGWVEG
ncbi:cold-shock protein [Streptomyces zhihengii]|uniref:cold-shock protein n=1 Tax=Streptomyces zhihengii TaxID=1818004 RepID=UPI0033B2AFED